MPAVLQIRVNDKLFLRDPEETQLGRKIIDDGIRLIDEIGFDAFTFRKLAKKIESTEASVYRYFSSKQQLLKYLVCWYYTWLEYRISYRVMNISDPKKKLEIAIEVLTESDIDDPASSHIDESLLHKIIVAESARVYLTKQAKSDKGLFEGYELLCNLLMEIIKEIDSKYRYPRALAITLIASVHKQIFYSQYFPGGGARTKGKAKRQQDRQEVLRFINHLVFTTLKH